MWTTTVYSLSHVVDHPMSSDLKKAEKRLRELCFVSLESSFVFDAVLWCLLPCPLSPWEVFDLLSFYRSRYRNTELFSVRYIYIYISNDISKVSVRYPTLIWDKYNIHFANHIYDIPGIYYVTWSTRRRAGFAITIPVAIRYYYHDETSWLSGKKPGLRSLHQKGKCPDGLLCGWRRSQRHRLHGRVIGGILVGASDIPCPQAKEHFRLELF